MTDRATRAEIERALAQDIAGAGGHHLKRIEEAGGVVTRGDTSAFLGRLASIKSGTVAFDRTYSKRKRNGRPNSLKSPLGDVL